MTAPVMTTAADGFATAHLARLREIVDELVKCVDGKTPGIYDRTFEAMLDLEDLALQYELHTT